MLEVAEMRSPAQITDEDLRQYFLYLANDKKVARATATIASSGTRGRRAPGEHERDRHWMPKMEKDPVR